MKSGIFNLLFAVVMILSFSLIPPVPAGAASKPLPTTIYADAAASGVEDGSLGKPFKKIQAAVDHAIDGDIIRVAVGTYNESVRITTDDVTVRGEAGAILDGSGVIGSTGGFDLFHVHGVTVEGFDIRNHSGSLFGGGAGIMLNQANNNHIKGNTVSDTDFGIILWFTASDNIVEDNVVSGSSTSIQVIHASHHNTIRNNTTSDSFGGGIKLSGHGNFGWPSDNIVSHNTISTNAGHGILVEGGSCRPHACSRGGGNVVESNDISGGMSDGIALFGNNNIAERNTISDGARAIHISGSDNVVKWNKFDGSGLRGVHLQGNGNVFKFNDIAAGRISGIFVFFNEDNVVAWNTIDGAGTGILVQGISGDRAPNDNVVKWNKVTDSGQYGIRVVGVATGAPRRNLIKENTVSGSGIFDLFHDGFSTPNTWTDNTCGSESGADIPAC